MAEVKKLGVILSAVALFFVQTTSAHAAGISNGGYGETPGYGGVVCPPTYGGGTNCPSIKFTIDKLVQLPNKGGSFVDNMGVNDAKYAPSSTVNFKIKITNNGTEKIEKLEVTDVFPQYLSFTSGVGGTYDKNSRTLKYTVNNLEAGKTQEVTVSAQVDETSKLPQDKGVVCVTNQVSAVDAKTGAGSSDSSSLCIEKNVLGAFPSPQVFGTQPVKQTPPTGPEMVVLPLLGAAGVLGSILRRKSNFK